MSNLTVARGGVADVLFNLLTQAGGSLTDDQNWVNGATVPEWPVVTVTLQGPTPTDVTNLFAKNIATDSDPAITAPGVLRHPNPATGIWRRSMGLYRFRVNPSNTLTLGDYNLNISYNVNGLVFTQTHTLTLVPQGSVDFGGGSVYCTSDDVLNNFELAAVVTSDMVGKAQLRGDVIVNAYLQSEQVDPVPYLVRTIYALNMAAVAFSRAELRRLIAGTVGPGTGIRRIKEDNTEFEFVSGDTQFKALHQEGAEFMDLAIKAILGAIYFKTGKMNTPQYSQPQGFQFP